MKLQRSALFRVALVLAVLFFAGTACSLSRGGDDDKESGPTAPPTITAPASRTPFATFTPFASLTPGQGFPAVATATRIAFVPTAVFVPTWTPISTIYPYVVQISYPLDGSQVAGYISVIGSASHPRFLQYALEWAPDPNPNNLWYPMSAPSRTPVLYGSLGAWNTTTVADGLYQVRLHVWLADGTETYDWVNGLRVSNRQPTAVPTLTPSPKPNQPPTINPIVGQKVTAGQTLAIAVVTADPDKDQVNLFVASSNTSVATVQVTSVNQITVTGITAGAATITVTANDNRGGLANTAFALTVEGQNHAPAMNTIGAQSVNVGATLDVPVSASDSDGDTLTVTAESSNTALVTVAVPNNTTVRLTGVAAGTANVTVSVSDSKGGIVKSTFQTTIGNPNQPPAIVMISPQTMTAGTTLDVAYSASDPNNDPLQPSVASDTSGVVTAEIPTAGTIRLTGIAAGTATVTLTVTDGVNNPVLASFAVTVAAGNAPPSLGAIGPQTMNAGQSLDVAYSASDPDSDPLVVSALSDNSGVIAASATTPGIVNLVAAAAGTATITVSVEDGHNPAVSITFTVSAAAVNNNPSIVAVGDQTVNVGVPVNVPVSASDPDGDTLTLIAVSQNPAVVTAVANGPAEIILTGAAPGDTSVSVEAQDGKGGSASISFLVTVVGVNGAPVIQPVGDQALGIGEQISVPVSVSDPDSDPLTLTAIAQDGTIVSAAAVGTDTVQLQGVGAGSTSVQLTADDAKGGVTTISFNVSVAAAPPPFDLMAYPVVPNISPEMGASLSQLYQSGVVNFGVQGGAFAKVGDDPMDSTNFMVPFAAGPYDLSGFGGLQSIIDAYLGTQVRPAIDPTINSFNVDSVAAGSGYGIDALSGVAPAGPPCDALGGGTVISCEFQTTKPAIALISFSAPNVIFMNTDQFRSELQSLVANSLGNYGVIPVLATIPAGGGYSAEQLLPYNQVIVEVATQSGTAGIPLWNLYRAMQERSIGDPNSVAPEGPVNFTDAALNYGANQRNLTALQVLQAVRQAANIN
ncbi:MAG: hypothetical protein HY866_01020 [Chloroflexi bacterium]|nr:hypothetical protein [Chloroflexota bacterium]